MRKPRELMQIQVGMFVAVGLMLLMTVIFLLGSEKRLFERQYTLVSHFEDISGLRLGAPVQLAGINVGTVENILFDDQIARKNVKVIMKISNRFRERIKEDSVATIVTQGLLGDRMVSVTVGSPEKKSLEGGDELIAVSPTGFTELMTKGDALVDNVNKVAKNVNALLEEVRSGKGALHELIYNPKGGEMVDAAAEVASNLKGVSRNAEQISGKINRGEGTIGALVNDPSLFNDMKTLLGKANRNKLIKAVIRETLRTKDEALIGQEEKKK